MLNLLTISGFWIELNERVPPLASHNCVPCLTGLHGLGTPPEHHHRQEDEGEGHALSHLDEIENSEEESAAPRAPAKVGAPKGPPPPTILGPPPKSNSGRVGGAAREGMSEPEGGATPPKTSLPKAKTSTVAHPGTGYIDITSSSVAGATPLPGDMVNAGELTAAPGIPLLRVSLPHRLLFNVELVVRTDPAERP